MKTILFQGDSITDAQRDRRNDDFMGCGYPTLVKAELGYEDPNKYTFYNRGVGGDRIVDIYARMKRDIINLAPDYMSILVGVNDVWHEFDFQNGIDTEKFEKIYCLMIDEIRAALPNIKLMMLEPFVLEGHATCDNEKFPNRLKLFTEKVKANAEAVKRVADKYSIPFVALQSKFDEACKLAEPSYWLIDGVHPSAVGHEIIKREWIKTFKTII